MKPAAVLMRRTRIAAGIAASIVWLSACAVGPNFERPEAPNPPGYTAEPTPTQLTPAAGEGEQRIELAREISAQWWQAFRSPELDDVIERALRDSPNLVAARATLAQAEQAVTAARGALFPQLDASGVVSRQRTPGASVNTSTNKTSVKADTSNFYSVGPTISYTLDVFGGIRRGVEQQAALAELQRHELEAAWLTLTGNAVLGSITIAALRAQIDASVELVQQDRDNLGLVQRKYEAGKAARSDVLVAQTQLAGDLALLPPLRQQLALAQHALSVLVGQLPGAWSPPEFALDAFTLPGELPLSLPSELVRQRPDILAAEAQLHASSAAIGVATAQLFPSLTLSGDLVKESLVSGGAFTAWALAAQVVTPVFHGGTLWAQRRGAIDAYHASLSIYEETVLTGFQQVADTLRALEHDADLVGAEAQLLDTARESLALQRISYDAGKSDLLLLLAAQRAYQQALLDYARAEGQRLQDTALLFVALGGGWWQARL
jgi:NodT family efflux transporter outer membrane factor (OMF) lipoprotein